MIKTQQAIIVEGKYDKIKLSSIVDSMIITTDGFAIFKDKEKQALIRTLAEKRGIILLTDSDSAGFLIRNFIMGCVPKDRITHVYIPDVFGKEKRKTERSKEGKIGVEGIDKQALTEAFQKAGVLCSEEEKSDKKITAYDLYNDGFTGGKDSRQKRMLLLKKLELPERLSSNALLEMLNTFMSPEEYRKTVEVINAQIN